MPSELPMRFLAITLFVAACSSGTPQGEGVPGCEGKCDGFTDSVPVAGPDTLIHCEMIARDGAHAVECSYTGVPTDFPVGTQVDIALATTPWTDENGMIQPGQTAAHEFREAGSMVVIDGVREAQLPVYAVVTTHVMGEHLVGVRGASRPSDLREIQKTFTFSRVGDATEALPLPYEFWRLRLFAAEGGTVRSTHLGPQEIAIAPWETFLGDQVFNHEVSLDVIDSEGVSFWLPVAQEARSVNARGRYCARNGVCTELTFRVDGPGVYKLASDGATRFDGREPPPIPVMDGGVDDAGAFMDAGFDATTEDTGPACGIEGQRPCDDGRCADGYEQDGEFCYACGVDGEPRCAATGACAPGHRWVGTVCRVCGGDDQTYCGDSSNRICNEGHRWVGTVCRVCGGDDQTYCGDSSNRICNEGHRWVGTVCRVCGGSGQTFCGDRSNPICDEGHRWVGTECRVCGGDGQTFCGDRSNPICDEGHRWVGTVCRTCGGQGETYCGSRDSPECDAGLRWNGSYCNAI